MTPEISHLCRSCGAAVRERDASFCPECGKSLAKAAGDSSSTEAQQLASAVGDSGEASAEETNKNVSPKTTNSESATVKTGEHEPASPLAAAHPHRIADKTRETLHRASAAASAAARGVIEEPVKRVERIRTVSSTVIEEASYDPSLRFVLAALGLFIVFVILLVLSKVMG